MQNNALIIDSLTKKYRNFVLDNVSFNVPCGTIVGLIGENGAGKSTTIKAILGLIQKDAGQITILGKREKDIDFAIRNQIGVVFDGNNFPNTLTPKKLNALMKKIYPEWNENKFFSSLKRLSIPDNKKVKTFSKGMKMKLSIAVAFSHNSKLLILDEATSGLDPVVRDDILDMFLDFVQNETHSILVSSHITGDLEKIADYIVFIHNGKVIFSESKDKLIYKYGIIKCGAKQFNEIDKEDIIAYRKQDYEWEVLISNRDIAQKKYPKAVIDSATIDEIMLIYIKGEQQ